MKKNRLKQCKKLVAIYKRMFNYHAPFLVLVDGSFCSAAAAQNMFDLRDRISNYLTTESTCCTTVCILNEIKQLEKREGLTEEAREGVKQARMIAQKFQVRHCDHKKSPVSARECIKSLVSGDGSSGKYFVATKDKKIQKFCDEIAGIPQIYMHGNVILLKDLSKVTQKKVDSLNRERWEGTADQEGLRAMRNAEKGEYRGKSKRKRKAKGPNPLSCKKKKKVNPN